MKVKKFDPNFMLEFGDLKVVRTLYGLPLFVYRNKVQMFNDMSFGAFPISDDLRGLYTIRMRFLEKQPDLGILVKQLSDGRIQISYKEHNLNLLRTCETRSKIDLDKIKKIYADDTLQSFILLKDKKIDYYTFQNIDDPVFIRKNKISKMLTEKFPDHDKIKYILINEQNDQILVHYDNKVHIFGTFREGTNFLPNDIKEYSVIDNVDWLLPINVGFFAIKRNDKIEVIPYQFFDTLDDPKIISNKNQLPVGVVSGRSEQATQNKIPVGVISGRYGQVTQYGVSNVKIAFYDKLKNKISIDKFQYIGNFVFTDTPIDSIHLLSDMFDKEQVIKYIESKCVE